MNNNCFGELQYFRTIAYNYLKNFSHHFTTEMRDLVIFSSTVELQYRKVDIEWRKYLLH
ncbi:MAG: hypothetical protein H7A42_07530 [Chlamydiales bacterium]|nr:hypothetical protein [Chlamydiales bacterium]